MGDSLELLPKICTDVIRSDKEINVFIHDSLHTYEHTAAELALVLKAASHDAVFCVDNIDMGSGLALSRFLHSTGSLMPAYRDFAAGRVGYSERR